MTAEQCHEVIITTVQMIYWFISEVLSLNKHTAFYAQ